MNRELSVRELKARLGDLGISYEGVVEKSELVNLLEGGKGGVGMSVSDLKDLIRSLAGRPSQCSEKMDLFNLAKELIGPKAKCSICLDPLLVRPSDSVIRVSC